MPFSRVAKDYGTTVPQMLETSGNEYLKEQMSTDELGREGVDIKPGQEIVMPVLYAKDAYHPGVLTDQYDFNN